ncbi:DUF1232 domain-containing protein [Propionivibrio soli]|uniref:DUF1232 domain-containing protein n=1 Tax=Propionivibrio soli TaxID=2976531 RepID=UPI003B84678B
MQDDLRRCPRFAYTFVRLLAFTVVAYVLRPIDLNPDFIPILAAVDRQIKREPTSPNPVFKPNVYNRPTTKRHSGATCHQVFAVGFGCCSLSSSGRRPLLRRMPKGYGSSRRRV